MTRVRSLTVVLVLIAAATASAQESKSAALVKQLVAALEAGKLDAYASDRTLLAGLAAASKDPTKLYLIEDFISYEPYALMVRRGDPNFHLAVDRALIRLYRSADVVPIYEKWFGPFPESSSLIAAVYVLNSVPD